MEKFRVVILWIMLCLVCIMLTEVLVFLFGKVGLVLGLIGSLFAGHKSQEIIYWIIRWLDGLVKK